MNPAINSPGLEVRLKPRLLPHLRSIGKAYFSQRAKGVNTLFRFLDTIIYNNSPPDIPLNGPGDGAHVAGSLIPRLAVLQAAAAGASIQGGINGLAGHVGRVSRA